MPGIPVTGSLSMNEAYLEQVIHLHVFKQFIHEEPSMNKSELGHIYRWFTCYKYIYL